MVSMLGKIFSRRHFEIIAFFLPKKSTYHFMQLEETVCVK